MKKTVTKNSLINLEFMYVLFILLLIISCYLSGISVKGVSPFPVTLSIGLLLSFFPTKTHRRLNKKDHSWLGIVIIYLYMWTLATTFINFNIKVINHEIIILTECIICFFIIRKFSSYIVLKSKANYLILILFSSLLIISALSASVIIMQYFQLVDLDKVTILKRGLFYRPHGFLGEPNFGSVILVIGMISGLFLYFFQNKVVYKVGILFGVLSSLLGVIYAGSRTGVILCGLSILGFILLLVKYEDKKLEIYRGVLSLFMYLAIGFLLTWVFLIAPDQDIWILRSTARVFDTIKGTGDVDHSIIYRIEVWKVLAEYIQNNPSSLLIGHGLGESITILQKHMGIYLATHNTFLALLFDTGIVGLIFFIVILFLGFYESMETIKKGSRSADKKIILWGKAGAMFIIIFCVASFSLHIFTVSKLFWIILGMISGIKRGLFRTEGYLLISESCPL